MMANGNAFPLITPPCRRDSADGDALNTNRWPIRTWQNALQHDLQPAFSA